MVELNIYTWAGVSAGAIHFYGDLVYKGKTATVECPLTESRAAVTNKSIREEYVPEYAKLHRVKPGQLSKKFDTVREVVEAAKGIWLDLFPDADELVDADSGEVYATRADAEPPKKSLTARS